MKLRFRLEEACEIHNNMGIMGEAPAFEKIQGKLDSVGRRIQGAIERTRMAEKIEGGWKAKKKNFEKSLEVSLPLDEVISLWAAFSFTERLVGDAVTPLFRSSRDVVNRKLADLDWDDQTIARDVADMLWSSSI